MGNFSVEQLDAWQSLALGPEPRSQALEEPSVAPTALEQVAPKATTMEMTWPELALAVQQCDRCSLSSGRRTSLVGQGSQKASWLLIADAPDENEDMAGEPFCGPSGQLLDAILLALGLQRERDTYIVNIVRCRPAAGRDPAAAEMAACAPYWQRQAQLLRPSRIVVLGRLAAQSVLGALAPTASLRGQIHSIAVGEERVAVVATYHPSYLLRHPEHKNRAWQDWLLAKSI